MNREEFGDAPFDKGVEDVEHSMYEINDYQPMLKYKALKLEMI